MEQAIRIEGSSGLSKEELERKKAEAKAAADEDKREREQQDKLYQAEREAIHRTSTRASSYPNQPREQQTTTKATQSGTTPVIDSPIFIS